MPETIRAKAGGFRADRRASLLAKSLIAVLAWAPPRPAAAEPRLLAELDRYIVALAQLHRHELAALALVVGVVSFAVVTAILLVRTRRRLSELESAARDETMATKAAIDRAYALLLCEPQILLIWGAAGDQPECRHPEGPEHGGRERDLGVGHRL